MYSGKIGWGHWTATVCVCLVIMSYTEYFQRKEEKKPFSVNQLQEKIICIYLYYICRRLFNDYLKYLACIN